MMFIRPISQLSRSGSLAGSWAGALAVAIAAASPMFLNAPAVLAHTAAKPVSNSAKLQQNAASANRGAPSRRFGGGSRTTNICAIGPQAMAMIAPADNVTLTTSAQPSLMFWVNESKQARDVEFVLRDGLDRPVYSKLLQLPEQAGLVTLDMAQLADAPKLEQNQDYYLYLSMICDGSDRSKDMVVEGVLRRVDAERQSEAGLWHDAMAQLNRLRQSNVNPGLQQQAERQWLDRLNADPDLSAIALETRQILRPIAVLDATDLEGF